MNPRLLDLNETKSKDNKPSSLTGEIDFIIIFNFSETMIDPASFIAATTSSRMSLGVMLTLKRRDTKA